jgi:hypothetical protein
MNLTPYEIEVLELMLKEKLKSIEFEDIFSNCSVSNYEYTGAGYFLELYCKGINLKEETIHKPIVEGKIDDIDVGFLLYVDKNKITIECHSWGDKNPPENIRDLKLKIVAEDK